MFGLNYLVTANYFLSKKSDQEDLYIHVKLNMYVEINLTLSHYGRVYKLQRKRKRVFSVLGQTPFHRLT